MHSMSKRDPARVKPVTPEELASAARKLFHEHYAGNPDAWFDRLLPESTYLDSERSQLFGDEAIRRKFVSCRGMQAKIVSEDYYPEILGEDSGLVTGQITVGPMLSEQAFEAVTRFSIFLRRVDGNLRIAHLHNTYEYLHTATNTKLSLDANALELVRWLLIGRSADHAERITLPMHGQRMYVHPYAILCAESCGRRTEVTCLERIVDCSLSISMLLEKLPSDFLRVHRSFLVNMAYVVAVRRFEVELLSGLRIPVPSASYSRIRDEIEDYLLNRKYMPGDANTFSDI